MTNKTKRIALVLAASAVLGLPLVAQTVSTTGPAATTAPAIDPAKVVLQVGSDKMTAADMDQFFEDLGPQVQQQVKAVGHAKRMLADRLVEMKLLAAEAQKRGLDKSPKFLRQMELYRTQALATDMATAVQEGMDDQALQKYFDDHKSDFAAARHILVRTPSQPGMNLPPTGKPELTDEQAKAKAEGLRKRVLAGEDFAAIAKAESDDPGSAPRGGELGAFERGTMEPSFAAAAFALQPGQISDLVKTPYGYHIIQAHAVTLDDVKEQLKARLGPEKLDQLIADLKKDNKIQLDEGYFGPAMSASMGTPGLPPGHPQ